jgi:hypothetical protein
MSLVHPGLGPETVRRAARRVGPALLRALLELVLVAVLFELYRFGRLLARGQEAAAYEDAVDVHRLEGLLHLPSEAMVQSWVSPDLLHLANVYYVSVHFPAMIAFLVWGYLFRPRAEYRWARNLVIALTATALVVHIVFPLAPPRMFPQWGFVDTMAAFGPDAYAGASGDLANQFAAMPSLHVGWAALIAFVVYRTGPRWVAALASVHVVLTVLVVVTTANHYWLDGVVALLLLGAVVVVLEPPARRRDAAAAAAPEATAVLALARGDR